MECCSRLATHRDSRERGNHTNPPLSPPTHTPAPRLAGWPALRLVSSPEMLATPAVAYPEELLEAHTVPVARERDKRFPLSPSTPPLAAYRERSWAGA